MNCPNKFWVIILIKHVIIFYDWCTNHDNGAKLESELVNAYERFWPARSFILEKIILPCYKNSLGTFISSIMTIFIWLLYLSFSIHNGYYSKANIMLESIYFHYSNLFQKNNTSKNDTFVNSRARVISTKTNTPKEWTILELFRIILSKHLVTTHQEIRYWSNKKMWKYKY